MGKRGPAPKGPYGGKTGVLSMRVRPDTREALERAAQKNGRPLSQEIEDRLRRSLAEDKTIIEIFGGAEVYAIMRLISSSMAMSENPLSQKSWLDDPYAFDQVVRTVNANLEIFRPPGKPEPPKILPESSRSGVSWYDELQNRIFEEAAKIQGLFNAEEMATRVLEAEKGIPLNKDPVPSRIKGALGDLVARIPPQGAVAAQLRQRIKRHLKKAAKKRDLLLTQTSKNDRRKS